MSTDQPRSKWLVLVIALLVLLLIGAAAFWGMYSLARKGIFDALLRKDAPVAMNEPTASPPSPTPSASYTEPQPTKSLITTAIPSKPMLTPTQTEQPTSTATVTLAVSPTPEPSPTPAIKETETQTRNPLDGKCVVEYLGCAQHGSDVGTVKGQVFDRAGDVIPGAEVLVSLDGWDYDKPAISNGAGWYEFYLKKGLKVKIVSLKINGHDVPLVGSEDQVFLAQAGCFEHVNLRLQ